MHCNRGSSYQEERVGIPLTSLTLPHVCACPKQGLRFPLLYVVVFFVFIELREVMVCFVDIGEFVDHNSLNFLFIIYILFVNIPKISKSFLCSSAISNCDIDCSLCTFSWCIFITSSLPNVALRPVPSIRWGPSPSVTKKYTDILSKGKL